MGGREPAVQRAQQLGRASPLAASFSATRAPAWARSAAAAAPRRQALAAAGYGTSPRVSAAPRAAAPVLSSAPLFFTSAAPRLPASRTRAAWWAIAPWAPLRRLAALPAPMALRLSVVTVAAQHAPSRPPASGASAPDLGRRAPIVNPDTRGAGRRARRGASLYEVMLLLPLRSA